MKLTICSKCESENVQNSELLIRLTYKGKDDTLKMHGIKCLDCGEETVSESDYHYIMHRFHSMKEEVAEERGAKRNVKVLPGGKDD